jgi:hypothetical protein
VTVSHVVQEGEEPFFVAMCGCGWGRIVGNEQGRVSLRPSAQLECR